MCLLKFPLSQNGLKQVVHGHCSFCSIRKVRGNREGLKLKGKPPGYGLCY